MNEPWTLLSNVANIGLGFKSLQNEFFYVNKETIKTYGIEQQYLRRLFMLRQLDAKLYNQAPNEHTLMFYCTEQQRDLKGTGAWNYIVSMADHAAKVKKQSGKARTIKQVLEAQGGGVWYFPKAKPHSSRLWLRKAFGSIYAPYLFLHAEVVDQRCNYVDPLEGVKPSELAALFTSSLTSYSIEINGNSSMGAGALELATSLLRQLPMIDPRKLEEHERSKLVSLAEKVWRSSSPIDWRGTDKIHKSVRELDKFLLSAIGSSIPTDIIYSDLSDVCSSRFKLAADKDKTTKRKQSVSIGSVAQGITAAIRTFADGKRFPDDFVESETKLIHYAFPDTDKIFVTMNAILGSCNLLLRDKSGTVLLDIDLALPTAEIIVQALLVGRREFSCPKDAINSAKVLERFFAWFAIIEQKVDEAVSNSSLGTGFENELKHQIYRNLGYHDLAGAKNLPHEIEL